MKKKFTIITITFFLILIVFITYIINNQITSVLTIDINPSIEIHLNRSNKVKKIIALNDDAKDIIINLKGKSLNKSLKEIVNKTIINGFTEENRVTLLLYVKGNIKNNIIKKRIESYFRDKQVSSDIILIDKISAKDKELSKKYNISISKAAYLNSILKNNNIDIKNIINKSLKELKETKETNFYCDKDYFLEGSNCLKEIGKEPSSIGKICPVGYYEYQDSCYEEKGIEESDKDVCEEDFTLKEGKCFKETIVQATGICKNGDYNFESDKCIENEYIGDAYEFCRDNGRTLYEHKCLATKPTINGGCLGSDKLLNGSCVNMIDDYYPSEWMCPNGKINSNADGTLLFPDNKCYEKKEVEPTNYKCDKDFILNNKECILKEERKTIKERICTSGYKLVNNEICINENNKTEKIDGLVCKNIHSRLKGNDCIIYEIKEAYHNN